MNNKSKIYKPPKEEETGDNRIEEFKQEFETNDSTPEDISLLSIPEFLTDEIAEDRTEQMDTRLHEHAVTK